MVAERLGLSYQANADEVVDLVVVGGGTGRLAAAIYGASEGLSTVLLDAVAPGGQAAATSRIENFLGFPFGVSGGDLIGQASLQALKFGVRVYAPCEAVEARARRRTARCDPHRRAHHPHAHRDRDLRRRLPHGSTSTAGRTSSAPGIYYAATQLELRQVMESPVVVVGGANSAGQASLYLAANGCPVRLVVRGADLGTRMSSYLVDRCRLMEDPRVEVHTDSRVDRARRRPTSLERVRIDSVGTVDARGLFCFIGADPATTWLPDLDRDADGFLRTGTDIAAQSLAQWQRLGREPLPFETSVPRRLRGGRRAPRLDEARRGGRRRRVERGRVGASRARRLTASVGASPAQAACFRA